jgi:hypothetical protein
MKFMGVKRHLDLGMPRCYTRLLVPEVPRSERLTLRFQCV